MAAASRAIKYFPFALMRMITFGTTNTAGIGTLIHTGKLLQHFDWGSSSQRIVENHIWSVYGE
jgi:hypothetical protein